MPVYPPVTPCYRLPVRRATISLWLLLPCTSQRKACQSLLGSLATTPLGTSTQASEHARHTINRPDFHPTCFSFLLFRCPPQFFRRLLIAQDRHLAVSGRLSCGLRACPSRTLHRHFTGDIYVNMHGMTREQAAYNQYAPVLMTSVDTDPALCAAERKAVLQRLRAGNWKIIGAHGMIKEYSLCVEQG